MIQTMGESLKNPVSYRGTFRHFITGQFLWNQFVLHGVVPGAFAYCAWHVVIPAVAMEQILGGLAIMTGFLFTLLVFIFQLRLQAGDHTVHGQKPLLLRLIDEMNAQTSWAVGVSLVLVLGLLVGSSLDIKGSLPPLMSASLAFLVVHLFAVIWTSARRTRSAYREMLKKPAAESE
jgi:hypothetical protein